MFGNPKGEVIKCTNCDRWFDIRRGTAVICACGTFVKSKEFSIESFKKRLEEVMPNSSQH